MNAFITFTRISGVMLLTVLAYACSNSGGKPGSKTLKNEAIPVVVQTLKPEEVAEPILAAGLFTTDDETLLSFKTGGVIERLYAKEGDRIRKGQLLAALNLTEIEAQVAQARLGYEKAHRDFERVENLYRDSVATLEQYQNVRTARDVAARQLEAAQFNRTYSEIRAVADGFILRKMASEGQVISSGAPVFQTNGAGRGQWILRTGVSDREWSRIRIHDPATVTCDALPGQLLAATVTRKAEGADAVSGTFTIELTLTRAEGLASGLFGKATILPAQKVSGWRIPYEALLDGNGSTGYVFVVERDSIARQVSVVIASISRDHVLVSSGLSGATQLIVSGSAYLKDGSLVRIKP